MKPIKPMKDRNPLVVAVIGSILAAALILLSVSLNKLPFLHPAHTYYAEFANADGLTTGADVRVEGISVGSVKSVKVDGTFVRVGFSVKSSLKLGNASAASVEIATVLGNLFMQVESAGPGQLPPGGVIPVSRTTVPYTLLGALDKFGEFSNQTDLPKLRASLNVLAQTVSGISPKDARTALNGLSSIAETVASKDAQISSILTSANRITSTLNTHSGALIALLTQGDEFLKLVEQRHRVISQLLRDTANLGAQLSVLISKDGAHLSTLLNNVNAVTAVLATQRRQLQQAVVNLGQFSVNIANATGSGPWLDLLAPEGLTPDNIIAACGKDPQALTGKPCQ